MDRFFPNVMKNKPPSSKKLNSKRRYFLKITTKFTIIKFLKTSDYICIYIPQNNIYIIKYKYIYK